MGLLVRKTINWKTVNIIFFPLERLSNFKSLIFKYILTQEQQENEFLSSTAIEHPTPQIFAIGYKKFPTFGTSFGCFISLKIKHRHFYSTRCHSKTAGKKIVSFLLWTLPRRSEITSIPNLSLNYQILLRATTIQQYRQWVFFL